MPQRRSIDVRVIDENLLEDNETVTVTLTGDHVRGCQHQSRRDSQRHGHDR